MDLFPPLTGHRVTPPRPGGAPLDDVVGDVRAAMAAFRPDVVVTLDASDGHRDHERIRDAAVRAARDLDVPRVYLQCLPRSLLQQWVDHMRLARPDVEHLEGDTAALGTPDEEITTVLDVRAHLPLRERAMALHASQTSPFEGLPEELRSAFLVTAVLVDRPVGTPSWPAEPLHRHARDCWWDVMRACWCCARLPRPSS